MKFICKFLFLGLFKPFFSLSLFWMLVCCVLLLNLNFRCLILSLDAVLTEYDYPITWLLGRPFRTNHNRSPTPKGPPIYRIMNSIRCKRKHVLTNFWSMVASPLLFIASLNTPKLSLTHGLSFCFFPLSSLHSFKLHFLNSKNQLQRGEGTERIDLHKEF